MDFSRILRVVYRYLWLVVLVALISSVTTYFVLHRQPTMYTVSTDLLIGPGLDTPSPSFDSLRIGGQLGQTYADLLSTDSFLEAVNNKLPRKIDLLTLQTAISNRQSADTRILTITVNYPDPNQAVAIANAAAQTLLEIGPAKNNATASFRAGLTDQAHQLQQTVRDAQARIQELNQELATLQATQSSSPDVPNPTAAQLIPNGSDAKIVELQKELADLQASVPPPAFVDAVRSNALQQSVLINEIADERTTLRFNLDQQNFVFSQLADERSRLSNALQTLASVYQTLLSPDTNQVLIIQPATAPTPVDQLILLKVLASGIGGLIFALTVIFAVEFFDDRLRYPGDLGRAAGAPVLSVVDKYAPSKDPGLGQLVTFARPESSAANRYREVVAKLLPSVGDSTPYSLLVGSLGNTIGSNAAMAAGNLAVAFAQAGYQVALVDAQVDNPMLTTIFDATKQKGLTDLLTTNSTELQLLPVEQIPNLKFLPAGLSSERSSQAMLNSTRTAALFDRLQQGAQIVLVAGSALSQHAENLSIASQVNAVILVASHAEARSKAVSQVAEDLRLMKIKLAGVIFDHNAGPAIASGKRRLSFAFGRGTSREPLLNDTLSEQTTES